MALQSGKSHKDHANAVADGV